MDSINYLRIVIKYKTGKSVNHWMAEKAIAELKAMLVRLKNIELCLNGDHQN